MRPLKYEDIHAFATALFNAKTNLERWMLRANFSRDFGEIYSRELFDLYLETSKEAGATKETFMDHFHAYNTPHPIEFKDWARQVNTSNLFVIQLPGIALSALVLTLMLVGLVSNPIGWGLGVAMGILILTVAVGAMIHNFTTAYHNAKTVHDTLQEIAPVNGVVITSAIPWTKKEPEVIPEDTYTPRQLDDTDKPGPDKLAPPPPQPPGPK